MTCSPLRRRYQTSGEADDRARLDQYFTGLRHLEQQFEQRLQKPEPIEACVRPNQITADPPMGPEQEALAVRHRMMTDLLVMAIACDQTRVFNMGYTDASSSTIKPGYEKPHHTTTHEEPIDTGLGYQPTVSWFTRRSMEAWAYFVEAFTKVREGEQVLRHQKDKVYGSICMFIDTKTRRCTSDST